MMVAVALAGLDLVLASLLLATYWGMYRTVRAPLTTGLTLFSAFFVMQGLVALVTYLAMLPLIPDELAPLLVVITALEAVGLTFLLRAARV